VGQAGPGWASRLGCPGEGGPLRQLGRDEFRPRGNLEKRKAFPFYLDFIQTVLIRIRTISKWIQKLNHSLLQK
jgi:hypothetical protein